MYNALVLQTGPGGPANSLLEEETFGRTFKERLVVLDTPGGPAYLFPLYAGYEMVPSMPELVVMYNGHQCLRVDCLNEEKMTARASSNESQGARVGVANESASAGDAYHRNDMHTREGIALDAGIGGVNRCFKHGQPSHGGARGTCPARGQERRHNHLKKLKFT